MRDWWLLVVMTVPLAVLWVLAVVDVAVRRRDLSLPVRVAWIVAFVLVSVVALAAYGVARPPRPVVRERRTGDGGDTRQARAVELAERRQRGELGDADYASEVSGLRATASAGR